MQFLITSSKADISSGTIMSFRSSNPNIFLSFFSKPKIRIISSDQKTSFVCKSNFQSPICATSCALIKVSFCFLFSMICFSKSFLCSKNFFCNNLETSIEDIKNKKVIEVAIIIATYICSS